MKINLQASLTVAYLVPSQKYFAKRTISTWILKRICFNPGFALR